MRSVLGLSLAGGAHGRRWQLGACKLRAGRLACHDGDHDPPLYCDWPDCRIGLLGQAYRARMDSEYAAPWQVLPVQGLQASRDVERKDIFAIRFRFLHGTGNSAAVGAKSDGP